MDTGAVIAERIERLVAERGSNPRAVALAAGMSPTGVRDIITRKTKNPTFASLQKIAQVLGADVLDIVGALPAGNREIAVAGRVGAGALVELTDAHAKGDGLYMIACPPQLSPNGIVGVEIEGASMSPVYQEGDVLLYSRDAMGVPSEAMNRICVCEDETGHAWVKQVRAGTQPGKFHLISANPAGENRFDVVLKWAAPVRLHLPAEFIIRT